MNTYRISGAYQLWEYSGKSDTTFDEVVIAETITDAIEACTNKYRNAVVSVAILKDKDVLLNGTVQTT